MLWRKSMNAKNFYPKKDALKISPTMMMKRIGMLVMNSNNNKYMTGMPIGPPSALFSNNIFFLR